MASSSRTDVLNRLSVANHSVARGRGIAAKDLVPAAEFYSRQVGRMFLGQLFEHGILYKVKYRRLKMYISVRFDQREKAFALLTDFKKNHSDVRPTGKRRDYDILFLCILVAIFPTLSFAVGAYNFRTFPTWVAPAYFLSAVFVGVIFEKLYRNYRYYGKLVLSTFDCFWLIGLAAVCVSVWTFCFQ